MSIDVSVIIPVFRNWQSLKHCLDSLPRQTYSLEKIEVIVVNNDPGHSYPFGLPGINIRFIKEHRKSSYIARNTGVLASRGQILAFTDADCIPDAGWIKAGVECLQQTDAMLAGGRVDFIFSKNPSPAELLDAAEHMDNEDTIAKHSCAVTANLFVLRSVFDRAGLFDQKARSGGDIEFTQRASSHGCPITYCKDAVVRHPARSFRESLGKSFRVGKGLLGTELKRPRVFGNRWKMLLLHFIPITNPRRILRTQKKYAQQSAFVFLQMLLISVIFGLVKNAGFLTSLASLPFKPRKA